MEIKGETQLGFSVGGGSALTIGIGNAPKCGWVRTLENGELKYRTKSELAGEVIAVIDGEFVAIPIEEVTPTTLLWVMLTSGDDAIATLGELTEPKGDPYTIGGDSDLNLPLNGETSLNIEMRL